MLDVSNLNAAYQKGFRIEGITFQASDHEITGIIGPNGAGKTTLLKALCRDIPAQGRIFSGSQDLSRLSSRSMARKIALVPQNIEKTPIPIMEFVLSGRTPYRKWFQLDFSEKDREKAWECLSVTGLHGTFTEKEILSKKISDLSGGERQLAAIARALCQEPELLLLDEPTSNLDLANQIKMMGKIREITGKKSGCTLMVIHDINLAANYCDRLVCLAKGKMICQGVTREVFTKELMEKVYGTPLCEGLHPQSGRRVILPAYR